MLRHILPDSTNPEIIALDAALRRGDLLSAQRQLHHLLPAQPSPELLLRAGVYQHLINDHPALDAILSQLAAGKGIMQPYAVFLSLLAAIDLRKTTEAKNARDVLRSYWRAGSREYDFLLMAEALLFVHASEFDEARERLDMLAFTGAEDASSWERAQALKIRGILAHQQTDYGQARRLLHEARLRFQLLGDRYEIARCDYALANALRRMDDHSGAQEHVHQAIRYFREQETKGPLARCYSALGSFELYFDQQENAIRHYELALELYEKAGMLVSRAWTLHNLGLAHRQLGQFRRALQMYIKTEEMISADEFPYLTANLLSDQAEIFWHMGENMKALDLQQRASDAFVRINAPAHAAKAWRRLGMYHFWNDHFVEAKSFLEKSSKVFLQHHRPGQAAIATIALARVEKMLGNVNLALDLLQTAADILIERRLFYRAGEALTLLAEIYLESERFEEAYQVIQSALELSAKTFYRFSWRIAYVQAQIALHQENIVLARVQLQEAIGRLWRLRWGAASSTSAARWAQEAQALYVQAIELALAQGDVAAALVYLEEQKATQFLLRLQPLLLDDSSPNAGVSVPVDPHIKTLNRLRRALHVAREEEDWRRVEQLEQELDSHLQRFEALSISYDYLLKKPSLDLDALRSLLDERHGFSQWGCFIYGIFDAPGRGQRLYRFWLDSLRLVETTHDLDAVESHLLALAVRPEPSYRRKMLDWGGNGAAPELWQRLEPIVLPPQFKSYIESVQTIYFSSSAQLSHFPFAALRLDGSPLAVHKNLSQIASLPVLHHLLQRQQQAFPRSLLASRKGVVCAIAKHQHKGLSDLPHTLAEAKAIYRKLSPESILLLDEQVTLSALRRAMNAGKANDFFILHFATHARFHPHHALLSHIVLHEDVLYGYDILQNGVHANLVTLAACETAIGHYWSGDEQMGLPHDFLIAGAQMVLATLWSVADKQSSDFLATFYEQLNEASGAVGEALRRARAVHHRQSPSPFDWGAWSLIGLQ